MAEKEYIERNAALRDWPPCDEPADAYQYIRYFPAADVRPVVQGRWEWDVLDGTPGYRPVVLCCSNCHRVSFSGWDFCPNCGADMRESKQESKQVGILEEES